MPKLVEKYAPANDSNKEGSNGSISGTTVVILLTLVLFMVVVSYNTYTKMSASTTTDEDKSRVCMAEFNQRKCDTLNLTDSCRTLFDCVQAKGKAGFWPAIMSVFAVLLDQAANDLPLPVAIVGLLMLQSLRHQDRNRHE